jgi:WD40 repeat protein
LFSADGKTLYRLAQTPDNATTPVMFWDVATRKLLRTITLAGGAGDVWLSPDGTTLAVETTAKNSAGLDLLDTRTGKPRPKPTFDQTAGGVAYSPDGRVLAVGLYDGRVLFWNTLTHRQIGAPLAVAGGDVGGLTFSPDGRLLAVDAGDGTATVWDVATRTRIGDPLPGPAGQMHFPAWLPDGNLFEVYQGNGVEWTMATRSWMAHACSVAGRDMTPAEWHDLLPHRPYQHVCLAT